MRPSRADLKASAIRSAVRFLCVEPLLEPVQRDLRGIARVIGGGESGQRARPMPAEWARDVRDQCRAARVPLFMKQMSRRQPIPDDLLIREFPSCHRESVGTSIVMASSFPGHRKNPPPCPHSGDGWPHGAATVTWELQFDKLLPRKSRANCPHSRWRN